MSKKPDKDFYDIVGKVEAAISLLPMPDLIHDKKVGALVAELKYKVNQFVNKRKCWWCGSKVKISTLSNEQKAVFYSGAICPECEDDNPNLINPGDLVTFEQITKDQYYNNNE